jgi:hypothetical protein
LETNSESLHQTQGDSLARSRTASGLTPASGFRCPPTGIRNSPTLRWSASVNPDQLRP